MDSSPRGGIDNSMDYREISISVDIEADHLVISCLFFFEIIFTFPKLVRMCLISNYNQSPGEDPNHGLDGDYFHFSAIFCFVFLRSETREYKDVKSFTCWRGVNIIKDTLHKDP